MNNIGLNKLANEDQTEVIQPEEKEIGAKVLCNSNCTYAQNPEKLCMLGHIALTMSKDGEFVCGQYSPVQEVPEEMGEAGAEKEKGENQANRQLGLAGAKTKQ